MALLSNAKILFLNSQVAQLLWVLLYIYNLRLDGFHTRAACHRDICVNAVVQTTQRCSYRCRYLHTHRQVKRGKKGKEENLWREEMIAVSETNLKFIQASPAAKIKKREENWLCSKQVSQMHSNRLPSTDRTEANLSCQSSL